MTASTQSSQFPARQENLTAGQITCLLDFPSLSNPQTGSSRLYTGDCRRIWADDTAQLHNAYTEVESALQQGYYAVVLASYEMGAALLGLPAHQGKTPLFEAYLFSQYQALNADERSAWLAEQVKCATHAKEPFPSGVLRPQAAISEADFEQAISNVHRAISEGETYQINFTFPLNIESYGHPAALYQQLSTHQPVAYGALLRLDTDQFQTAHNIQNTHATRWILSRSPELFVQAHQRRLTVRPMKGTVAASEDTEENQQRAEQLANDIKNRAENVMIVDLLRNDLNRIAEQGSVKVTKLFTVEHYRTVLQMTSTIEAKARAGLGMTKLWEALFPCGSITGAPKHHTMRLIYGLEKEARGLYTGALGWMDPPTPQEKLSGELLGNFCFSVPIRTLDLQVNEAGAWQGRGRLNVGSGIVYDSIANQEWLECLLKARFLTELPKQIGLIETFVGSYLGYQRLEQHLARLEKSAKQLGLLWGADQQKNIQQALEAARSEMLPEQNYRCRLLLNPNGEVQFTIAELTPLKTEKVKLIWAKNLALNVSEISSTNPLLRFKTTHRAFYDAAWQAAEKQDAFDAIFVNSDGYVTEGGRSTLWIKQGDIWQTPALSCGVLPGIMRQEIFSNPQTYGIQGKVEEALLRKEDVLRADEVCISNSLRGWMLAGF